MCKALMDLAPFSKAELSALGALLDYLELSQAGAPARLRPPLSLPSGAAMVIDPAARMSLEIDRTLQGSRKGSLIDAIDRTLTAPGARLLADRLARPSMSLTEIQGRLDAAHSSGKSKPARQTRERLKARGIRRGVCRVCFWVAAGRGIWRN